ncbi:MAG: TIR domain-containing protein, partial [Planctomycetota bacterium]
MNASSSSRQYHYESQGVTHGPVSGRALRALAAAGKIAPTDTVWEVGSEKRYRATKVRGLLGEAGANAKSKGATADKAGDSATNDDIVTATLILDDTPTNASPTNVSPFAPVTLVTPVTPVTPLNPVTPAAPVTPVTGNPFATNSTPSTRPATPSAGSAPTAIPPTKPASSSSRQPAPKTTTQPITTSPAKTSTQSSNKSATKPASTSAHKPATTPTKDIVLATSLRDVFISYSSKDKPIADAICAILEQERIRCWIAPRDIRPGQEYAESILNAINASRMMVIVLSASSNASPHVLREVERGVSKGIPVIPFRVEDIKPSKSLEFFLSAPHWLDALTTPLEDHIHKLVTVAKTILETQPDDPDRSLGGATRLAQMRSRPRRTWLKPVGIVGTALALMLALFMLWRSAGPNPLDTELAEFKRNLDLGNGSIVFLN